MKKNVFKSLTLGLTIALSGIVLTGCGGETTGSKDVQDAISAAESGIPVVESPVFGTLPSLLEQKLEAGTILGKKFREMKTEDMDEAVKNKQLRDEAEDELKAYYDEKIGAASDALEGKNVKVEFDNSKISAASVKLAVMDKTKGYFNFVFDVTPAQPVNKEVEFKWLFMDAEGNELESGSDYIVPGNKLNCEYMVTAGQDFIKKFDHLYLKY